MLHVSPAAIRALPNFHSPFQRRWWAPLLASVAVVARANSAFAGEEPGGAADDIEVRGPSLARGSRDADVSASVVRRAELSAPGLSAADVLRAQTGVSVNESGGAGALATAQIRGATSAQTPVYLADIRINDDVTGSADLSLVPLWLLSRVEIYRGNAPIEAGPGGIGGAIFLDPKRPQRSVRRVQSASFGALAGSFGMRGASLRAEVQGTRAAALVGIRTEAASNQFRFRSDQGTRFDESDDRDETRRNADAAGTDVWAIATFAPATREQLLQIDVLSNQLVREQGIAGLALAQNVAARVHTARSLYGTRVRYRPLPELQLTASSSLLLSESRFEDPLAELALGAARAQLSAQRGDAQLGANWTPAPAWKLAARTRIARDELGFQQARSERQARRTSGHASLQARRAWDTRAYIGALASAEWLQTTSTTREPSADATPVSAAATNQLNPSGRLSAGYTIGAWALSANAGAYARVPTLGELYGFSGFVRGNPALRQERGLTAELAAKLRKLRISDTINAELEAVVYLRSASDLVAFQRSSLGFVVPFNVGDARVLGAELQAAARFGRWVDCKLGLTLQDPRNVSASAEASARLPFQSVFNTAAQAQLHLPRIALLGIDTGTFTVSYTHQSTRAADPAGLVVIPAQGNLSATLALQLARSACTWSMRASNVLASQRFDSIGLPLPLRAFYSSLEINL